MHMVRTCCDRRRGLVGEPVDEVGVDGAFGEDAGAAGGDAAAGRRRLRLVDRQEGVEHGGDEDGAALVRLGLALILLRRRLVRTSLAGLGVVLADGAAQGAVVADRLAELHAPALPSRL